MKTFKFFILALSLFLGTNLSAKCFEMKIVAVEKPPTGFECYEITVTFLAPMAPGECVWVTDGEHAILKLSTTTTFTWCYPIGNQTYTRTFTCETAPENGCKQNDGCIVIVDGFITVP